MRRRAAYEPSSIDVETIGTAPPPYEAPSEFNANAPVPPQYRETALALESPQPSVLASSSSHNETLHAPSPERVEEVTTPPAQPEIESLRSTYQPREFDATRRVPSSHSPLPINREVGKPWGVYQEQLSSLNHGCALWEPRPVEALYDRVSIGDVGYTNEGHFYRMFNVTLPWDDPSNTRLGEPDHYKPLDWGPFVTTRGATLAKSGYYSRNVSSQENSGNLQAREPRE